MTSPWTGENYSRAVGHREAPPAQTARRGALARQPTAATSKISCRETPRARAASSGGRRRWPERSPGLREMLPSSALIRRYAEGYGNSRMSGPTRSRSLASRTLLPLIRERASWTLPRKEEDRYEVG